MGFAVTWCAVREEHAQSLLRRLGLSATGEKEEVPESLISTGKLDTGWRLLWYNEYGCPFLCPDDLRSLSSEHEVLLCQIEEHVMASSAEMWRAGKRQWWISHEGEDGPRGLEVDGQPPECLASIRREMEATQRAEGGDDADVDWIFEIPLRVAQALVGFKHDETWDHLVDQEFAVLERSTPERATSKRGLLLRLFGR